MTIPDIYISQLKRAEELLNELKKEYNLALINHKLLKTQNLAEEVLVKLRTTLDKVMHECYNKYSSKKGSIVYFPITKSLDEFNKRLSQANLSELNKSNPNLYNFLKSIQIFETNNQIINLINEYGSCKKHVELIPEEKIKNMLIEKREELVTRRQKTITGNACIVSFNPDMVKFGERVSIAGAPINPITQDIEPTKGVNSETIIWTKIIIKEINISAIDLCEKALNNVTDIITTFFNKL